MEPTIVGDKTLIEIGAIQQIYTTLKQYPFIKECVGMPDLHPGPGIPIGAAFTTDEKIIPRLIGGDIGCGMSLFSVNCKSHKFNIDKNAKKLEDLDLSKFNNKSVLENNFNWCLGTLGGGNHFAEFQEIEKIVDSESMKKLDLNEQSTMLLVHSGSRNLGQAIAKKEEYKGVLEDLNLIKDYLSEHDIAVKWAHENRQTIAKNICNCLNYSVDEKINIIHNYLQKTNEYIHRKGVGYTKPGQLSIIPGSRGSFSYIVKMTSDIELAKSVLFSIAHGAGRRYSRSDAESRMKQKYSSKELKTTQLGSKVVSKSASLLFQEAPESYKSIDNVIQDLVDHQLITVVAVLRPLLTFKQ